jgi:hypothetical protein
MRFNSNYAWNWNCIWQCIVRSAAHCLKGPCNSETRSQRCSAFDCYIQAHSRTLKLATKWYSESFKWTPKALWCYSQVLYLFGLQRFILCLKTEYSEIFRWFLRSFKTNAGTVSSTMFRTLPYLSPGRGTRFIPSPQRPDLRWSPPSLLFMGTGEFLLLGKRGRAVKLTTHLRLVPRPRMSRVITLFPLLLPSVHIQLQWAGQLSRHRGWLRAGRSGDRIAAEARFSTPVQTGPGTHPASCTMGTGSFLGVKYGRGVLLTTHPLLVPWSWKSRAIPLPILWATPGL